MKTPTLRKNDIDMCRIEFLQDGIDFGEIIMMLILHLMMRLKGES